MKTQVLRSVFALSAPLENTPILPAFDPSLMASFDKSTVESSDGVVVTAWRNKQGVWGSAADLVVGKPAFPTRVGTEGVIFPGGGSESFMDSSLFATPMSVGKATFMARVKFTTGADTVDSTVFSSTSEALYVFLRRKTTGVFAAGVNTPEKLFTTQTLAVGVWANLALVVDGADSYIYINDIRTKGDPRNGGIDGKFASIRLGANAVGALRLIGEISKYRVYSRALTADEIADIHVEW